MTDEERAYLEMVSDKIRGGEPVGMLEAIAAINYQETLRAEREAQRPKTIMGWVQRWFRAATSLAAKDAP